MITTEAMGELCALMEQRRLSPEDFAHWVVRQRHVGLASSGTVCLSAG